MLRFRARRLLLAVPALVAIAAAAAPAQPARPVAASAFRATLKVPGHHPKAGRVWPVTVTATYRGRPTRVRLTYQYLFNGKVVSTQHPDSLKRSGYRFTGRYTDREFVWPARAAGIRLTFRAVVSGAHGTRRLDYWVVVVR